MSVTDQRASPPSPRAPRKVLRGILTRWPVVVIAVVLTVAAAVSIWFVRPAQYTATIQLYVSAQAVENAQAAYQGAQLSEQRVSSYVELVNSPRVLNEVAQSAGVRTDLETLSNQISASTASNSVIIDVEATATSPQAAATIADAVGEVFPRVVESLERPTSPTGVAPVLVRMVQPAELPLEPSSLGLTAVSLLALVLGLILGCGGAALLNSLDTTIAQGSELAEVASAPLLGTLTRSGSATSAPLVVHHDPQSINSEEYRQLRTALGFVDVDKHHKLLAFTSPNAGEGKTTLVANLAVALASSGRRVLAIEADLRRPKLADLLGLTGEVGLTTVLSGRARLGAAIQQWGGGGFDLLASGPLPPNPSELLGSRNMASILDDVTQRYDYVLIDLPPTLPVADAAALAARCDGTIVVGRYRSTTSIQVSEAIRILRAGASPILGVVMTMAPSRGSKKYASYSSYEPSQTAGGRPLDEQSAASRPLRASDISAAEPTRRIDVPGGRSRDGV